MKSIQQQHITQAQVDNSSINTVCEFNRQHEYVKYYTILLASFPMIDGWYQPLVCTCPRIISSWPGHPDPAFRQTSRARVRCQWQWSLCSWHRLYHSPRPEWPYDDDDDRGIEDVLITSSHASVHPHLSSLIIRHKNWSSDYNSQGVYKTFSDSKGCPWHN